MPRESAKKGAPHYPGCWHALIWLDTALTTTPIHFLEFGDDRGHGRNSPTCG